MCKNTLQNDVQEDFTKQFTKNVQEKFTKRCAKTLCKNNLQNDVQEHCADAQEQKKFSQIGKSCEAGFLKYLLEK